MPRLPRSLRIYIVASTIYAAVVFIGVQVVYTVELGRAGLLVARRDTGDVLASIQSVSFVVWLGISLIAAAVMVRLAKALAGARSAEERRGQELGTIFSLSSALAGPVELEQIARQFLDAVRRLLDPEVTAAVIVYDDVVEAFRCIAEDGPAAADFAGTTYSASTLPAIVRTRVIDHRQACVLADTAAAVQGWPALEAEPRALARARSFAALPLVSSDRLVGALLLRVDRTDALDANRLQLPMMLGQYVAGAILSAFQVAEAEARADRESMVNRVAQQARVSLDPEQVLRATVEQVGRALAASRAIAVLGATEDDLRVAHEWCAAGVSAIGTSMPRLPVARRVARLGRTSVVRDVLEDFDLLAQMPAEEFARVGVRAVLAAPITVGAQLTGVLVVNQADRPRDWTSDEVRLVEAVARELRVALEAARLYQQQSRAVVELERLNKAKSDFVSIVSHEFRTPLTGIQGFSEMMRDEDLTADEVREYAGDINKDAQRLNRMISEMLDLDRMESGRMTLNREAVDLNALIAEAADHVRPTAPNHPISLRLDPAIPRISGDRDKLIQVVRNLLSNAVKYSPNGGDIVITTRPEGEWVHGLVKDDGMGIPEEALESVFERYGRVESRATRYIQGTGLGLPICRQIVQLHGGRIWAESVVGEGSLFHFTLPARSVGSGVES